MTSRPALLSYATLVRLAALGLLAASSFGAARAQDRPLPDRETFTREVRARLRTDDQAQDAYSYVETRKDQKLDGAGRVVEETLSVIESYPGFPGEPRWERTIVEEGKPVPQAELAREDGKRQREAEEYARQGAAGRARVAREQEEERRENEKAIEDAFRAFNFEMVRRERINNHDTILVTLEPKPNAQLKTQIGRIAHNFHGRVWISESDYEMVKLEIDALRDVSFGLGVLARIHKGTRLMFERRKVNNEAWLPARMIYSASARVLLLRRMRVGRLSEYGTYKRFNVDTDATYSVPASRP